MSGLYFRGKLAYAAAFGRPHASLPPAYVITAGDGLLGPDTLIGLEDIDRFASVSIDIDNPAYIEPLARDLTSLAANLPPKRARCPAG